MKCKECNENEAVVKKVEISIRYQGKAIEIVADDVCFKCLQKSIDIKSEEDATEALFKATEPYL